MANYVMVLMIGIMVFAIGAGLIKLNHYYAVKRSNGLARFITTDCKKMLEEYTDNLLQKTMDMTTEMTKKMMEIND